MRARFLFPLKYFVIAVSLTSVRDLLRTINKVMNIIIAISVNVIGQEKVIQIGITKPCPIETLLNKGNDYNYNNFLYQPLCHTGNIPIGKGCLITKLLLNLILKW